MFIAEIGINHNGNLEIAKSLILTAKKAGADVVKFQKRTPNICVPKDKWDDIKDSPFGKMKYIEYKRKIEFEKKEYDAIDAFCKEVGIKWTASVWDIPSLEFILQYDVPFIKVASAQITDTKLLKEINKSGKDVIISTGGSTLDEIDEAVNILDKKIIGILHCVSIYPTYLNDMNLNVINTLKDRYNLPTGLSDHSDGTISSIVAYSMGAEIIERHITLDKGMKGSDHASSLNPKDLFDLIESLDTVKIVKGKPDKIVLKKEKENMEKLRLK